MGILNRRKNEHVRIAAESDDIDQDGKWFERIKLIHRALPEINFAEIDCSVEFMGHSLALPLLISSMTGGGNQELLEINRNLALAANREGVAMAVGSQRVLFSNPEAEKSFNLRQYAPDIPLLANLGAVQLNEGMGLDECRKAIDLMKAEALCLHLNPLQEVIQPEGDTNFAGLAQKIGLLAENLEQPIIVKSVGAGLSTADIELLLEQGVAYIDVAGAGGTSWSRIESKRADENRTGDVFRDWGIPTPLALRLVRSLSAKVGMIASGGVRSGLDMAKGMILDADLCGVANPFLEPALISAEAVCKKIQQFKREFATAMFVLGCRDIATLKGNRELILEGME